MMSNDTGIGTIILAVHLSDGQPSLVEAISDQAEIRLLERWVEQGENDPLKRVHQRRSEQHQEDEKFSDYVEELLSRPFLNPDLQRQGVQWLQSRLRIERFRKEEAEAAKIIAQFAFEIFRDDRGKTDFILAGPSAQVRVRILLVSQPLHPGQAA